MCRNQRMCESSYEAEKSWTFQKSKANYFYNTASISYYFYMYITTSSCQLLSWEVLFCIAAYICLRSFEVYPDSVQYNCDRLFCVPKRYCPWKIKALLTLPFANSQALVIHRDPVSRGASKKKTNEK